VIEASLTNLGRGALADALHPGLAGSAVRELASVVEVPYRASRSGAAKSPGFYFLSLEDATASYRAFRDDPRWTSGWLPIFANGGGDFYVVDLDRNAAGGVRHFGIDEAEHPIEFSSLATFLATLAESFRHGVFFVDEDGYLEMEDARFAELAAVLDPEVQWWRE
ncbi:MAG TPA: SMI1/KNR4 family protein, partial [Microbacterium sp.]|nr:SMI1/KNR4 family protein [Microbacterium sp.]